MYGSHGDPGLDPLGYGLGVVVRLLGKMALVALIWVLVFHQIGQVNQTVSQLFGPLTTYSQTLTHLGG